MKRLSQIDRTLREQHTLRERHTHEVVGQITVIEQKKQDLQKIETALQGIPQVYMIRFLNSVIRTANQMIKEVFSYPLAFQLLSENKALDYRLPFKNDGETIADVSHGSKAQKAMMDFAFNKALSIQTQLTHCPTWLDEVGDGFDHHHEQKLIQLLGRLAHARQFSQLFLVNHHAVVHGGLANAEVLVLDDTNILTPSMYNQHALIKKDT